MGWDKVPVGALIGSGAWVVVGLGSTDLVPWFGLRLLVLGFVGMVVSLARDSDDRIPDPGGPEEELEHGLRAPDDLKERDIITTVDHRRKRKKIIDAWGLPSPRTRCGTRCRRRLGSPSRRCSPSS